MKSLKICPECGALAYYNSYFGTYICENCNWEDESSAEIRLTDALCRLVRTSQELKPATHTLAQSNNYAN